MTKSRSDPSPFPLAPDTSPKRIKAVQFTASSLICIPSGRDHCAKTALEFSQGRRETWVRAISDGILLLYVTGLTSLRWLWQTLERPTPYAPIFLLGSHYYYSRGRPGWVLTAWYKTNSGESVKIQRCRGIRDANTARIAKVFRAHSAEYFYEQCVLYTPTRKPRDTFILNIRQLSCIIRYFIIWYIITYNNKTY